MFSINHRLPTEKKVPRDNFFTEQTISF